MAPDKRPSRRITELIPPSQSRKQWIKSKLSDIHTLRNGWVREIGRLEYLIRLDEQEEKDLMKELEILRKEGL